MGYLHPAYEASETGYQAAFLAVAVLAAIGALLCRSLIRRPPARIEHAGEPAAG